MNKRLRYLAFLAFPIAMASCKKDEFKMNTTASVFTIKSLFDQMKIVPQTYGIETGKESRIVTEGGSVLFFDKGSFLDEKGEEIIDNHITVEVIEANSPFQKIAMRVFSTDNDDQIVEAVSMMNVKASLGYAPVTMGPYNAYVFNWQKSLQPSHLMKGYTIADNIGQMVYWETDKAPITVEKTITWPVASGKNYYNFEDVKQSGWMCFSRPSDTLVSRTDFQLKIADTSFNPLNTQIFVFDKKRYTVTQVGEYDPANLVFSAGRRGSLLPVGDKVTIIVLGAKKNSYYMDLIKDVRVTPNMQVQSNPYAQSARNIMDSLTAL